MVLKVSKCWAAAYPKSLRRLRSKATDMELSARISVLIASFESILTNGSDEAVANSSAAITLGESCARAHSKPTSGLGRCQSERHFRRKFIFT